jgi:hypothetical protein
MWIRIWIRNTANGSMLTVPSEYRTDCFVQRLCFNLSIRTVLNLMLIHQSTLDEKESFNFCGIKYAGKGIHALMEEVEAERYDVR